MAASVAPAEVSAPFEAMAFVDLAASVRAWLDFLEVNRYSPDTIRSYRTYVRNLIFDLGVDQGLDPREITEEVFTSYVLSLNIHAPTREGLIAAAKSYWRHACRRRVYDENPAAEIRNRTTPMTEPQPLTEDQLYQAVTALAWMDSSGRRAWTMILELETGARVSSIAGVLFEDVPADPQPGRWIHFRFAKNDRPYSLPLTPLGAIACRELLAWDGHRHRPTLVGVGKKQIWQWWHDAAVLCGFPESQQGTHVLRDTFATNLADRLDVPVTVILRAVNHADYRSLRRYLKERDEQLKAAMARASFGEHTARSA